MSRVGCCYDNAIMESFFGTLKTECTHRTQSRESVRVGISAYLEGFYNRRRLHSSLGNVSPDAFEQAYERKLL